MYAGKAQPKAFDKKPAKMLKKTKEKKVETTAKTP
jgi:hypothetical protein